VSQENLFIVEASNDKQIENKITILYLIEKMDVPMSEAQVTRFAEGQETMGLNAYTIREYLHDMVKAGYLETSRDGHQARFSVTHEGAEAIEVFIRNIPQVLKNAVVKYIGEMGKEVRHDLEVVANSFYNSNINEYTVKCGAYEDDMMLMELNLSVVTKEQALLVCKNWREGINRLYGKIIGLLMEQDKSEGNL
jgi:DNA-binding PadR family transcriptional regulator